MRVKVQNRLLLLFSRIDRQNLRCARLVDQHVSTCCRVCTHKALANQALCIFPLQYGTLPVKPLVLEFQNKNKNCYRWRYCLSFSQSAFICKVLNENKRHFEVIDTIKKNNNNWTLQSKQGSSAARKKCPVERNLEQNWTPEQSFALAGWISKELTIYKWISLWYLSGFHSGDLPCWNSLKLHKCCKNWCIN